MVTNLKNPFYMFKLKSQTDPGKEYDKPTAAQVEARKHRERIERMEEEKQLNDEIADWVDLMNSDGEV